MKRIGLLGGMSWESTAEYYRLLNEEVRRRRGGLHSADLLMRSVDFTEIVASFEADRWDQVAERLGQEAQNLERAGAQILALCTNTGHRVADSIRDSVSIPFVDIIDVAIEELNRVTAHRALILGTRFTMAPGFYRDRLTAAGIEAIVPADPDAIDTVIFDELCQGVCSDDGRSRIEAAIGEGIALGAQAVVLACTELELLEPLDSRVPVLATTRLHCAELVRMSLDETRSA